ncbi:MAG: alpha/beta hydrolase [Phycisphaerae bacterium]
MAATQYWMITNRNVSKSGLGSDRDQLSYWMNSSSALTDFSNWTKVSAGELKAQLRKAADQFPVLAEANHESQRHVTLAIHGFNVTWKDAVDWYQGLCDNLFTGNKSLGVCVLFTWPSDGKSINYLPDRIDAEKTAPELAEVFSWLYDWLLKKQADAAANSAKACKAKTSIIAHSMGNFVLQRALQHVWTRKNQPLLLSLLNQVLMVAADVDNDLFRGGEAVTRSDGDAIANLTYRVTALYTGRDSVLGLSAGMKHFGKRRLGRSGLDRETLAPDNVWDIDCSDLFRPEQKNIHSAYFYEKKVQALMRDILRGVDRLVIQARHFG